MKTIGNIIGGVLVILLLIWGIQGNSFFIYKFFAPKYEQIRRETFEESKAYNQGMVQELQNMQFEYIKADKEHKAALASVILHRAADYPTEKMPYDLKNFITQLKENKEF